MKKTAIILMYFLLTALLFTQCQQPRPNAESSSDPGAQLFVHYCSRCHLGNGIGGPAPGEGLKAADIRQFTKTPAELEIIIADGFGQMPPFKDSLTVNEISNIANYVATQIEAKAGSKKPQPGDEKFR